MFFLSKTFYTHYVLLIGLIKTQNIKNFKQLKKLSLVTRFPKAFRTDRRNKLNFSKWFKKWLWFIFIVVLHKNLFGKKRFLVLLELSFIFRQFLMSLPAYNYVVHRRIVRSDFFSSQFGYSSFLNLKFSS